MAGLAKWLETPSPFPLLSQKKPRLMMNNAYQRKTKCGVTKNATIKKKQIDLLKEEKKIKIL